MKTSAAGRALITQREGCILKAYRDSRGIPTIGVGHVDMTPPKTVMGMVITKERADELLAADLGVIEAVIAKRVKVPLTQNQFDALASLGFNIGVGGLARSSAVGLLNRGDIRGAADAFLLWKKPAVLLGRRKVERAQFLATDATTPRVVAARAKSLARKADATEGQASAAKGGATTAAIAGSIGAIAAAPHHPWLAGWLVAAVVLAIVAGSVVAFLRGGRALELRANAGAHSLEAAGLGSASTDLADSLKD